MYAKFIYHTPEVHKERAKLPTIEEFDRASIEERGKMLHLLIASLFKSINNKSYSKRYQIECLLKELSLNKRKHIKNNFISSLVFALNSKHPYTAGHSLRVTMYSLIVGNALGLPQKERKTLIMAALLHDIGKLGVPDKILKASRNLELNEYFVIKQHTRNAELILRPIKPLKGVLKKITMHHEAVDGSGYHGRVSTEIPKLAKIIAVADSFDAMTSYRGYKKNGPLRPEKAFENLKEGKFTKYCNEVVDEMKKVFNRGELTRVKESDFLLFGSIFLTGVNLHKLYSRLVQCGVIDKEGNIKDIRNFRLLKGFEPETTEKTKFLMKMFKKSSLFATFSPLLR